MRELVSEYNFIFVGLFFTVSMFIIGGLLKLIEYFIDKLTDHKED